MNKGMYGFGMPPSVATRVAPGRWANYKMITSTTSSEVVPQNVYQIGVAVWGGGGNGSTSNAGGGGGGFA